MTGLFPSEREERAKKIVGYLKKAYPVPKTELKYHSPFQLVVAVVMSAQCTDKLVNTVTESLFQKYKTPRDFAEADLATLTREIGRVSFYQNKAKNIIAAAKKVVSDYGGKIPKTDEELVTLPGVGYKTAHVVLGELYDIWEGIATDTHVKRFAQKFDLTDNKDPTKISKDLERLIPKKDWRYVNNGLVLYGRYVCKAHVHDCSEHPLTKLWPPAGVRWPKTK
jgi:endonuclease-3